LARISGLNIDLARIREHTFGRAKRKEADTTDEQGPSGLPV